MLPSEPPKTTSPRWLMNGCVKNDTPEISRVQRSCPSGRIARMRPLSVATITVPSVAMTGPLTIAAPWPDVQRMPGFCGAFSVVVPWCVESPLNCDHWAVGNGWSAKTDVIDWAPIASASTAAAPPASIRPGRPRGVMFVSRFIVLLVFGVGTRAGSLAYRLIQVVTV